MDRSIAFIIGPLTVRWYGILIALAFALGSYLAYREVKRQKLNVDELLNMLLIIIPSAIIGARLYYVAMRWDYYGSYPQYILQTWQGGLAVHGGIIAALLAVLLYCRLRKLNFLHWVDMLTPSLALGQAIGRWGNFFNQEAYGYETDLPWAMLIDGAYRHPTFLYESLWCLLIFALLMWLTRHRHRLGSIFAVYLISYSAGRFFIEMLRTDSLMIGSLRMAMVISVLGVLVGLAIIFLMRKQPLAEAGILPPTGKPVSRQMRRAKSQAEEKKRTQANTKKKNTKK
ncbi:MAG: prolipoprotein diacylglyceryl transferase [Clostridiales bacterium]|nr:prolipoprotein diacylglyceryl transferase [Clostridiales bacterium]